MAQPTQSDLHVDALLSNISLAFIQDESRFVSDKVFPNLPVEKQSDLYAIYDRGDWWRDEAQERAPGTESVGSGYTVSNTNYFAKVYAIHKDVDEQVRANADSVFKVDADATRFVTEKLLIRRENLWVSKFFKTSVWSTDLTGVGSTPGAGQFLQWDLAGNKAIEDITNAVIVMFEQTGKMANTLVLSPYVFNALRQDPEILDRIKYTQRGIVTEELLAALFGVPNVLVPGATNTTTKEGQANLFAFIFGKGALLCYSEPNPGLQTASGGYTFSWTGYLGAQSAGNRIIKFPMLELRADRVEGEMAFDQKLIAPDLGTFFTSCIS